MILDDEMGKLVRHSSGMFTSPLKGTAFLYDNENNNEKTSTAKASDGSTLSVKWTSNQVMNQSSVMQWQKDKGYIFNSTDLGTIKSIDISSTAGTFTTYYGTSKQPSSGTTVGNGYFQIKIKQYKDRKAQGFAVFTKNRIFLNCIKEKRP